LNFVNFICDRQPGAICYFLPNNPSFVCNTD
jgi:hypothetical protein